MLWLELNCIFILLPSNLGNGIRRSIIQFFLKILLIGLSCVTYHRPTIHSKICRSIYFNCKRRQQTAESKTRIHLNETWRLSSSLFLWASENNFILIQISPRPCLDHHHHLSSKSRLRSKQAMYYMRNSKLAFHNWSFKELLLHFPLIMWRLFSCETCSFYFCLHMGGKLPKRGQSLTDSHIQKNFVATFALKGKVNPGSYVIVDSTYAIRHILGKDFLSIVSDILYL